MENKTFSSAGDIPGGQVWKKDEKWGWNEGWKPPAR